jgi:hypothetical protein
MAIKSLEECVTIDEDDVKEYIVSNYQPEDIYSYVDLEYWAEHNGFIKKEENENNR